MGAYYDTHSSPEPVDEFLCDVNVKALEGCSVRWAVSLMVCERWIFADMQRQEWRKGGPLFHRSACTHKLRTTSIVCRGRLGRAR
jgi:hypothetical protein